MGDSREEGECRSGRGEKRGGEGRCRKRRLEHARGGVGSAGRSRTSCKLAADRSCFWVKGTVKIEGDLHTETWV